MSAKLIVSWSEMAVVQRFFCFELRTSVFLAVILDLIGLILGFIACGLILANIRSFIEYIYSEDDSLNKDDMEAIIAFVHGNI